MKKALLILGAAIALASCSKSETVYVDSEIGIDAFSAIIPKGGPHDAFPDEMFKTISFFAPDADHTTAWNKDILATQYFDWTTFNKLTNFTPAETGTSWAGASEDGNTHVPQYWPKTGSLFFAGYYPADITKSNVEYNFTTANLKLEGFEQKAYTYEPTDGHKSTSMDDLMWFDVDSQNSANKGTDPNNDWAVKFKHALSWITIKVIAKDEASAKDLFTVKSITINNINYKGTFNSKNNPEWTSNTPTNYEFYKDGTGTKVNSYTTAITVADGLLAIPQSLTDSNTIVVTYNQAGFKNSDDTDYEFSTTIKLNKSEFPQVWEVNHHYTYTLTFSADEILLAPTVSVWEPGTDTGITVQ